MTGPEFLPGAVVWKYLMATPDEVVTFKAGTVLHVGMNPGTVGLAVWVAVLDPDDDGGEPMRRRVVVRGTGDLLPPSRHHWSYVNTFHEGPFVFHAFVTFPEDVAP